MTAATPSPVYRLAWFFYLALAIAGALWLGLQRGRVGLSLFVVPSRLPFDVLLGVGAAALLGGGWTLVRRALPLAGALEGRLAAMLGALGATEVAALALLSGFAEELFFRGAVQSAFGPLAATLVFALLHSGPGRELRAWSLFALAAGALFAALTHWRGTLLPAALAHVLVNLLGLRRLAALAAADARRMPSP